MTNIIHTERGAITLDDAPAAPAGSVKAAMSMLQQRREQFEAAASPRMPADAFFALLGTVLIDKPDLPRCSQQSLFRCAMLLCALGLDPTGRNNGAALIARKGVCVIQFGYGALIDLATRDGRVRSVDANVVYDMDEFSYTLGTNPTIIHVPNLNANRDRDGGIAYYAVVTLSDGSKLIEVMTRKQVEDVKRKFAFDSPAWKGSFDEMGRKTVLRLILKRLPQDAMATQAIKYMDDADSSIAVVHEQLSDDDRQRIREAQQKVLGQTKAVAEQAKDIDDDGRAFIESLEEGK